MNDLARILRGRGHRWECAWVTEPNLEPGLLHVHGLQHGDDVEIQELAATWGARVELLSITAADTTAAARYMVKETRRGPDRQRAFLNLNGGRALHWSGGFLPSTRRQADQALRAESMGSEELNRTWHLEA